MRVIVCGSRNGIPSGRWLGDVLANLLFVQRDVNSNQLTIIHGGASGVDSIADEWAFYHGAVVEEHRAAWKKYGSRAGPIRNQKMIDAGADLVIAFPGGHGTADMVKRARAAGIEVEEVKL